MFFAFRQGRNLRSLLVLTEIHNMKPQSLKEFAMVLEGNNKHLSICINIGVEVEFIGFGWLNTSPTKTGSTHAFCNIDA